MTTLNDFIKNENKSKEIKLEVKKEESTIELIKNKNDNHLDDDDKLNNPNIKNNKTNKNKTSFNKIDYSAYIPWNQKYEAKKLNEFIGHQKEIQEIKKFIENYSKEKKKTLIIYGNNGIGKSLITKVLANELNLEFIEFNASDKRNKKLIDEKLNNILQQKSLFGTDKIVLVDEIDGLSGTKDRGGIQAVVKASSKSKFPIILTCKDPFVDKLKTIKVKSKLIEFKDLNDLDMKNKLKYILDKENIKYAENDLELIIDNSQGDLRAAINDIQMLSIGRDKLDSNIISEIENRLKTSNINEALNTIFTKNPKEALSAYDRIDNFDFDKITLWIDENMPKIYTNKLDRARAYGCLTKANVFKKRIMKRQHWRFLVYINFLLSFGISSSKSTNYSSKESYDRPTRILKIWQANMKYNKRKTISEKIASATHTSSRRIIEDFPLYANLIVKSNIAESLDLDKDEITFCEKIIS